MASVPVLIAGAGPTGLVLALWLTKLGVRVRIVDKLAEAGTTSRALAVQARTLEFYRQAGLAEAVVEAGVKVAGLNLWVNGAKAVRVPLEEIGKGMSRYSFALTYPQDEHERLLIGRLEGLGVKVERVVELVGFEERDGGVRARLKRADGSEEICEAGYLAGCDGARSIVREVLGTGFPGGTYSQMFYVADVAAEGPAADGELHVDFAQSDFVAVFPMKGKGRVRLVGSLRPGEHGEPTFEDASSHAIRQLKLRVVKVNWFSTYHVHHRVAEHFRRGRAFLLGDAAHIHSPVGGQGMNTGIGDAVNLAWKLAAVVKGTADERILGTYEPERIGFARRLVKTTDRAFTLVSDRRSFIQEMRTKVVPLVTPVLFRLNATRHFLFRTLSQIGIRYRKSELSVGRAGAVHGGDRLPWVELGDGTDNFGPLDSLGWQVHVYGEVRAGVEGACRELGLPLHVFGWSEGMFAARLRRGATYVVRPDGYIGLADLEADGGELRRYFKERNIRVG